MNQEWQSFLLSQGHQVSQQDEAHRLVTPAHDNESDTFLTALSHSALLRVDGPDSEKFLQGQLTCDVTQIDKNRSNPGAACTPQGRVYSNFQLIKFADHPAATYFMRMHSAIIENTLKTLGKYAVFFKAELSAVTDDYVGIGIWGKQASNVLNNLFDSLPQDLHAVQIQDSQLLIRVPGELTRFEYWGPIDAAESIWRALAGECQVAPTAAWELEDIRSGIAHISPSIIESFTPHMLNYKAHQGISFEKGCYTGQEIVARTEYRGKAKRALHCITITGDTPSLIGSQLSISGKSGTAITQVKSPERTAVLLVLQPEFAENQQVDIEVEGNHLSGEIRAFG